jgi:hypothetical protein
MAKVNFKLNFIAHLHAYYRTHDLPAILWPRKHNEIWPPLMPKWKHWHTFIYKREYKQFTTHDLAINYEKLD